MLTSQKSRPSKIGPLQRTWGTLGAFYDLASFYRHFVSNFSSLALPLNELLKKSVTFHWVKNWKTLSKR